MSNEMTRKLMKKIQQNSAKANTERGLRLEEFLQKIYPDNSWLARSKKLGFSDSTVIGWRKGREIPGDGLSKLHELGCNIYWLLTGKGSSSQVDSESANTISRLQVEVELTRRSLMETRAELQSALMRLGEIQFRLQKYEQEID